LDPDPIRFSYLHNVKRWAGGGVDSVKNAYST